MLTWDNYFRKFVNRKLSSLLNPRIFALSEFELPKYSVVHYTPVSFDDKGLSVDCEIFAQVKKHINITFIEQINPVMGEPRYSKVPFSSEIRKYLSENKRFRRCFDLEKGLKDIESPLYLDYCFASRGYKYILNFKKEYSVNTNWIYTVINQINTLLHLNQHSNHFLFLQVPERTPTLSQFKLINTREDARSLSSFNSLELLYVLHLWNLIRDGKDSSTSINGFGELKEKLLNQINIVFIESGYYSILNLGTLKSFIKSLENPEGKNPRIVRGYLLRFLLALMKIRTEEVEELIREGEETDLEDSSPVTVLQEEEKEESEDLESDDDSDTKVLIGSTEAEEPKEEDKSLVYDKDKDEVIYDDEILSQDEARELKLLEEQLKEVEKENKAKLEEPKVIEGGVRELYSEEPPSIDEVLEAQVDDLIDSGTLSPSEAKKALNTITKYKSIQIGDVPIEEYVKIPEEDVKVKETLIPSNLNIKDKNQLKSTLINLDKQYISKVLEKDIASSVLNLQKAGVCVTDYSSHDTEDTSGLWRHYTVKVTPLRGKSSQLNFSLPIVTDEGTYTSNSIEMRLRRQKGDLPVRKVSPIRVALTSSYGKVFIERSEKKTFNFGKWLTSSIREASFDRDNHNVTQTRSGDFFDHHVKTPIVYSSMAKEFKNITANQMFFSFDYKNRFKTLGQKAIELEKKYSHLLSLGLTKERDVIGIDNDNNLFVLKNNQLTPLGSFLEVCGLNERKAPISVAEATIMGKTIPIGIVLGYHLGFESLLNILNTPYRIEYDYRGKSIQKDEYSISFKDCRYVFKRVDRQASLILNGFNVFNKEIRDYNAYHFNSKDVYFSLLDSKKQASRVLKELDLLFNLFIDPITLRILEELKEPKTFRGLLFRAVELLLIDYHPDEVSGYDQRIRGYERMSALVYSELIRAIRQHNNKANKTQSSIQINPSEIKLKFLNDPANVAVENLNPFQEVRQIEAVTFTGLGGRAKETMVKRTRKFDRGDIGVISEATSDSGDAGINTYLTANPCLNSVYGTSTPFTKQLEEGELDITKMTSTVFNVFPCIETDDSKRITFASIQSDANIACSGYEAMPLRTGYESILPYRTGLNFCSMALEDGVVTEVTSSDITITYDSGEIKKYPLGRKYGSSGGLTVPHFLVTNLKSGNKVKKGDCICYNKNYFQFDETNTLTLRYGVLATTAILESSLTLEDSSVVTKELADKLTTYQTKIKDIRVDFTQEVHHLVEVGAIVKSDDVLCILENEVTSKSNLFDESSIELLKVLGAQAPKAKTEGTIEKIEVYYCGEVEEMSPSLQELVKRTDKILKSQTKVKGRDGYTGKVSNNFLIGGEKILPNTLVIRVYITGKTVYANGDKAVFANQMKTTTGEVLLESPTTESGVKIDAIFGARSISARIVNSPVLIGTTNRLLIHIGKLASQMYKTS